MTTVDLRDVAEKIGDLLGRPAAALEARTALRSLLVDSFALIELAIGLQEDFAVIFTQDDLKQVTTVGDIVDLVRARLSSPSSERQNPDVDPTR